MIPHRWFHRLGIVVAVALLMILTVDAQRGRIRFELPPPGASIPVDDFHVENEWRVFEAAMRKALPDGWIERLTVVINDNMDTGNYMEHSGRGFYAVDPTNEAFTFGVKYIIYGLTH